MSMLTTAVKAMVLFDLAYLGFVCAEDLCLRIHKRIKKKKGEPHAPYFLDDEDDGTDFSLAPPLCMDSLRLLHRGNIMDFIEDRIISREKAVFQALPETEREMAKLLLASCIGFLAEEAPYDERSFPILLEVLRYCGTDEDEADVVEMVMQDNCKRQNPKPEYYCLYRKYKLVCRDKERAVETCRVIVNDILTELYQGYHNLELDSVLYDPLAKQFSNTASKEAEWEAENNAFGDC